MDRRACGSKSTTRPTESPVSLPDPGVRTRFGNGVPSAQSPASPPAEWRATAAPASGAVPREDPGTSRSTGSRSVAAFAGTPTGAAAPAGSTAADLGVRVHAGRGQGLAPRGVGAAAYEAA